MIKKTSLIAIEIVAGLLVLSAVLVGVAVWRLSSGPVPLDFLTPYVEEAFEDRRENVSVDIGSTLLVWLPKERSVALHVQQARMFNERGELVASLPLMGIDIDMGAMLRGEIIPAGIQIIGPRLNLVRAEDGHFEIGGVQKENNGFAEPGFGDILPEVLKSLMAEREAGHPLAYLDQVEIAAAKVRIDDRKLGMVLQSSYADISIRRDQLGLAGEFGILLDLGGDNSSLEGAFVFDRELRIIDLAFQANGLQPQTLSSLSSDLSVLSNFAIPVSASVATSVSLEGSFGRSRFDIIGGAGTLAFPDFNIPELPIQGLMLKGNYSKSAKKLSLENAAINFGTAEQPGPKVSLAGNVAGIGEEMQVLVGAKAVDVPLDDLGLYWPEGMADDARSWVTENIRTGMANEAVVKAVLKVPSEAPEEAELVSLEGALKYENIDVHYLRPLPPVRKVSGTADVYGTGLTLFTDGGELEGMSVLPSTIEVSGLDVGKEVISIQTAVEGPFQTALEILNHDRLKLIDELGISPDKTGGDASVAVDFEFPLLKDLAFEQIEIDASADVANARIERIYNGLDATHGDLKLDVTGEGMKVAGPLRLDGVPLTLEWEESFSSSASMQTSLKADFPSISPEGLIKLGIPVGGVVEGPSSLSLALDIKPDGQGKVELAANLQDAALTLEPINYRKETGVAGHVLAAVALQDGQATAVERLSLEAGDLVIQGRVGLRDGDFADAQFQQISFGNNLLNDVSVSLEQGYPEVVLGGGVLDATAFLEESKDTAEVSDGEPEAGETGATEPKQPFSLIAENLDAVYFGEDRYFNAVALRLLQREDGWERIQFRGNVPESLWHVPGVEVSEEELNKEASRELSFTYQPLENGTQGLYVSSNDFGSILRALDVIDTVQGGGLQIVGEAEDYRSESLMTGHIEASTLRVVKAPVLAKMLTFASLTGALDTLGNEGIRFDRLTGDFTLRNGVLKSDLIKFYGASIGLTAKGLVDTRQEEIDVAGTIVPAYTINRILGGIPLLGTLLTGGEGEGIVAFNYTLTGSTADPKVSINPLSALTPGFLRKIFGSGTPGAEEDGEAQQEEEQRGPVGKD